MYCLIQFGTFRHGGTMDACKGRMEANHRGQCGSVCDDSFDDLDAGIDLYKYGNFVIIIVIIIM